MKFSENSDHHAHQYAGMLEEEANPGMIQPGWTQSGRNPRHLLFMCLLSLLPRLQFPVRMYLF